MKRLKYLFALATILGLAIGCSHASETKSMSENMTVEGTLVDSKCYGMMHANIGKDHQSPDGVMKGCATKCAKDGIPVAVLQKNGKVLILAAPAKVFAPYMAERVRVVGMVPFEGTIIPEKVEVQMPSGAWKEVKISTMM